MNPFNNLINTVIIIYYKFIRTRLKWQHQHQLQHQKGITVSLGHATMVLELVQLLVGIQPKPVVPISNHTRNHHQ